MWSDEQKKIIESEDDYQQIIAGAGSGKTATLLGILQRRESQKTILPERTLVVTFTNKASHEFQERVKKLGLSSSYKISTFHAFCYRSLKEYDPSFPQRFQTVVQEGEKVKWSKQFFRNRKWEVGGIPYALLLRDNAKLLRLEFPNIFADYQSTWAEFKKENRFLELEDILGLFYTPLLAQESWTESVKRLFDFYLVDEFQDTDPKQLEILRLLEPKKLTVVGDDWQAIYGFRGASPEPFWNLQKTFPKIKQFFLSNNYRSLPGIVHWASIPLSKSKKHIPKKTIAQRQGIANLQVWELGNLSFPEAVIHFFQIFPTGQVLVRSNFRKEEWIQEKFPQDQVCTIHASKGLEWDHVLVDLTEGWQLGENSEKDSIEEERRILYVALSRAKDSLVVLGRKSLKPKERGEDCFFRELKGALRKIQP